MVSSRECSDHPPTSPPNPPPQHFREESCGSPGEGCLPQADPPPGVILFACKGQTDWGLRKKLPRWKVRLSGSPSVITKSCTINNICLSAHCHSRGNTCSHCYPQWCCCWGPQHKGQESSSKNSQGGRRRWKRKSKEEILAGLVVSSDRRAVAAEEGLQDRVALK